jgi:ribosomal protein S18 acetylase RimI-like enzyme
MNPIDIELAPVVEDDFEELAGLRIAAMRESLERVGRFDPVRARERLRSSFVPERTRFVVLAGERVGFLATQDVPEGQQLDHLYIHPGFQGRGIGSEVLKQMLAEADARGVAVLVGALKESASNRFYQRHGFVLVSEGEWDNYYMRPALQIRFKNQSI